MDQALLDQIRISLQTVRELDTRSAAKICARLGGTQPLEGLASRATLEHLEDWEQEGLLSLIFTPAEADRVPFEAVLPPEGVPGEMTRLLASRLVAEGVTATVRHGLEETRMWVPPVVIERWVRLLHLDCAIAGAALEPLAGLAEGELRLRAFSLARQPVWHRDGNGDLLLELLGVMSGASGEKVDKLEFLTAFVNTYRPQSLAHLVQELVNLVESYRAEEGPIFNQRLEDAQALHIPSQQCGEQVKAYRLAMSHALLKDLRVVGVIP
ncbi:MAG: hypothetical protein HQL82_10180 [Magnetococcales bacterium]|nr:hypothetical protein [Magnetococcales bacterium]